MTTTSQSIHCGSSEDSFDTLKRKCNIEAEKLCATINVKQGEVIEIPFWTSDMPELICIGKFSKSVSGKVEYILDFSESTL